MTATADYGAFGEVRSQTGTPAVFGFTGEQMDQATGLLYLRARYYDPGMGRMLSPDSVQPNAPGTQGYNLYAYVANNPTSWVDPTGNQAAVTTWLPRSNAMAIARQFGTGVAASIRLRHPAHRFPDPLIVALGMILCVLDIDGPCWEPAIDNADRLRETLGSDSPHGIWDRSIQGTLDAASNYPRLPSIDMPLPDERVLDSVSDLPPIIPSGMCAGGIAGGMFGGWGSGCIVMTSESGVVLTGSLGGGAMNLGGVGINAGPIWTNARNSSDLKGESGAFGGSLRAGKFGLGADAGITSNQDGETIYTFFPYYGIGLSGEFHGGTSNTWVRELGR